MTPAHVPTAELAEPRFVLGGNVFGGTADEATSFRVLDAYLDAGGTHIDTADVYASWVPGCRGGESETIIGRWLARRAVRDRVHLATKVGMHPETKGLSRGSITRGIDASLRRLGTDHIDLYYTHVDDRDTPLQETLGTFADLVSAGKIGGVAASNYRPERLTEALRVSDSEGFPRVVALQAQYNLVSRARYETTLAPIVRAEGLAFFPYFSLASGFLTGKYRRPEDLVGARAPQVERHLDERGLRVLTALDEVAANHEVALSAVALAWLAAQPTVTAPMASARTVDQLENLLQVLQLQLEPDELELLSSVSAPEPEPGPS